MLSKDIFEKETDNYKKKILPDNILTFVIESGCSGSWYKYAKHGNIFSINSFGKSAPANEIFEYFGFSSKSIYNTIMNIINNKEKELNYVN
jgi:transketolase